MSVPDPPATYPDGTRFPGVEHLRTMERISRIVDATGAPACDIMAERAVLVEGLISQPGAVELTTQLVTDLGDGRRWLDANHLEPEGREYGVIIADLAKYWAQSGAMQSYADSLK